jgi:Transcriptional regulators of sugar metabolism
MNNTRKRIAHECQGFDCQEHPSGPLAGRHRAINSLLTLLDERSRRMVAAALAKQHGRGGIGVLARITGMSRMTIRRGLQELAQPDTRSSARIRRPGGGRKKAEKKIVLGF